MELKHLADLWDDAQAATMDEPELLRYRSNLLGSDPRLTNYGGGNTSAKVTMADPVSGDATTVLWVKGSGGDLGTMGRSGFATLTQDKLEALKLRYRGDDHEDEMVDLYPLCAFGRNSVAPSIDTPLHAFVPFPHVDHLHPDWAIALAASANGPALLELLRAETGIHLVWLPWKRPGFELGLWLEQACRENPDCDGILLGSHGIFTWGNTSRESYVQTIRVLDAIGDFVLRHVNSVGDQLFGGAALLPRPDREALAAALLPVLRGRFAESSGKRSIGHFCDLPEVLRFTGSRQASQLAARGTSCPDHFLRTKVKPLFVEWDSAAGTADDLIAAALAALPDYADDYTAYYEAHRLPDSPARRGAEPSVVLVPGVGMLSFGRNAAEARITGEFYVNAIHVMEGATAMAGAAPVSPEITPELVCENYVSLPPREAFKIEYWALEEAKIRRMPPEKEMARSVAIVFGSGPGIGRSIARRLIQEGAVAVCADRDLAIAEDTAAALRAEFGRDCAVSVAADITDRAAVRAATAAAALRYGGIDTVVVTAAIFFPPDDNGDIPDDLFRKTLDVNVTGNFIAAHEGGRFLERQGIGGSIVLISSANAVVPKKGGIAYDTGKTAVNHMVRELAMTFAPRIRVNAVAPASVVAGSLMFPRHRVESSLDKYNLPHAADESDDVLRDRLSTFYAQRTLLKKPVTPTEVTEAVYLLASPRLGLTTGHVVPVDAGLPEAFLR